MYFLEPIRFYHAAGGVHRASCANKAMMIRTEKLTKVYNEAGKTTTALHNINMEITAGEFVAIVGPEGSGKTTLLNIIGLLDNPDGGSYYFDHKEVSTYNENERAALRKGKVGYVSATADLIDELNVYENIELPLLYLPVTKKERRERVTGMLVARALLHKRLHFPHQLSPVQQQQVAIARAMISNPALLLADEPAASLDNDSCEEVMRLLGAINDSGTTIIMTTQASCHASYAHRTLRLLEGKIITENIREQYTT
jgi:putative ABC transport system ATP-binding protein